MSDNQYACVIKKATKKTVLKSTTHFVSGDVRWAWVPRGVRLVKMMVLVTDEPISFSMIENFSTPPKHERSKR